MNHRTALRLAMVLAAVFLLAPAPAAQAAPPKWEYLVVTAALQNRPLEQMLNARGSEGWELVALTRKDVAIFKRRAR